PEEHAEGADATREAATLEALRGTVIHAPELLWLDADGAVLDRPAIAMTMAAGDAHDPVTADPGTVARLLAETLATLQWLPTANLDHLDTVADPVALAAALPTSPPPPVDGIDWSAVLAAVHERAPSVAPLAPVLSHGDFRVGN